VALPQVLALVLAIDVAAYFAGLLFWYAYVMTDPATPWWAWLFIPDCPLFGLLGGIGLLMVIARREGSPQAVAQGRRTLAALALGSVLIWLTTRLPAAPAGWAAQGAMWAVWSLAMLAAAVWLGRAPAWLLSIFAFGQIKYGIWTITAWLLYWRSTALYFGAPHFSADSISMTVAHIGLMAQGIFLLTYFRPTWRAALAAAVWFGASDFVDYGLGFFPQIPQTLIPLPIVQWSTIAVTVLLTLLYLAWGWGRPRRTAAMPGSAQPAQIG
jgi:uncharacterized membrane protein YpjA